MTPPVLTTDKAYLVPQAAVFVLVFSMQRSASTTLMKWLFDYLSYSMMYEVFNPNQYPPWIAWTTNMTSDMIHRYPCVFRRRLVSKICAHPFINANLNASARSGPCVTGFKLFHNHLQNNLLAKLVHCKDAGKTKVLILKRRNVMAQHASLVKAITTGNWGTNPEEQKKSKNKTTSEWMPIPPTFIEFVYLRHSWFRNVTRSVGDEDHMSIFFEDLISDRNSVLQHIQKFVKGKLGPNASYRSSNHKN